MSTHMLTEYPPIKLTDALLGCQNYTISTYTTNSLSFTTCKSVESVETTKKNSHNQCPRIQIFALGRTVTGCQWG